MLIKGGLRSYVAPEVKVVIIHSEGRILTGSPENPGGVIDPYVFDEDE